MSSPFMRLFWPMRALSSTRKFICDMIEADIFVSQEEQKSWRNS